MFIRKFNRRNDSGYIFRPLIIDDKFTCSVKIRFKQFAAVY